MVVVVVLNPSQATALTVLSLVAGLMALHKNDSVEFVFSCLKE